jgi:fatty-acyl-CoA synthase
VVLVDRSLADRVLPAVVECTVVFGGSGSDYEGRLALADEAPIEESIAPDDPCMLPFTSGTTGKPKGIVLTHGNLSWNVFNVLSVADIVGDDVTLAIAPFFRTGGTGVNVLPVLWKGGTVVVPERVEPDEILRLIEAERATVGFGNPDLLEALVRSPRWKDADLTSIRSFMIGGAPVPERLVRTYLERGVTFLQGYGLSEAAPAVSLLDAESALRKVGSAGHPLLHIEVRIVRPDETQCDVDEVGELWVRGPNVMAGYWNRPEATRRAIDDAGWLRTGDAVRRDEEGFLYVVGRVVDMYVVDGVAAHPGTAERVLLTRDDVSEACVIGRDDGVEALIIPVAGASVSGTELIEFCRAHLPARECPTRVRFVESLPRNPGGKIMRHLLRDRS